MVGLKKELKVIKVYEWKWGLVIKGLRVESQKRINIVVLYNNGKMEGMLKSLSKVGEEVYEEGEGVLLMGDFNARIGEWQVGGEGRKEKG